MSAPEKLTAYVGIKLTENEKQSLISAAQSAGCSVGEYVRRLHRSAIVRTETRQAAFALHTVDDLGPDPLWSGAEALKA